MVALWAFSKLWYLQQKILYDNKFVIVLVIVLLTGSIKHEKSNYL